MLSVTAGSVVVVSTGRLVVVVAVLVVVGRVTGLETILGSVDVGFRAVVVVILAAAAAAFGGNLVVVVSAARTEDRVSALDTAAG